MYSPAAFKVDGVFRVERQITTQGQRPLWSDTDLDVRPKHRPIGRDCTDRPGQAAGTRCSLIDVSELKEISGPVKSWLLFLGAPALAALCDDVGPCCALASSKTTNGIVAATSAANSRVAEPQISQSFADVAGKPHSSNQSGRP